ncbi:MAG: ribosome-binding factor A [bacterium]
MSKRKEKLEHQIQKELIEIIRSELDDPRVQDVLLSVTKVRISNDLIFLNK